MKTGSERLFRTDSTHQLLKVDQVVMERLISLVDKGDIYEQGTNVIKNHSPKPIKCVCECG